MKRLIEQETCEHGEVKSHPTAVVLRDHLGPGQDDIGYDWSNICPGGSSRELAVDFEAAVKGVSEKYGERLRGPGDIWMIDPRALVRDVVADALKEGTS